MSILECPGICTYVLLKADRGSAFYSLKINKHINEQIWQQQILDLQFAQVKVNLKKESCNFCICKTPLKSSATLNTPRIVIASHV